MAVVWVMSALMGYNLKTKKIKLNMWECFPMIIVLLKSEGERPVIILMQGCVCVCIMGDGSTVIGMNKKKCWVRPHRKEWEMFFYDHFFLEEVEHERPVIYVDRKET